MLTEAECLSGSDAPHEEWQGRLLWRKAYQQVAVSSTTWRYEGEGLRLDMDIHGDTVPHSGEPVPGHVRGIPKDFVTLSWNGRLRKSESKPNGGTYSYSSLLLSNVYKPDLSSVELWALRRLFRLGRLWLAPLRACPGWYYRREPHYGDFFAIEAAPICRHEIFVYNDLTGTPDLELTSWLALRAPVEMPLRHFLKDVDELFQHAYELTDAHESLLW